MKRAILAILLLFAAVPLFGLPYGNCTAQHVTGGLCSTVTEQYVCFAAEPPHMARLQAMYAALGNYQQTVECAQNVLRERGVLLKAGVNQSQCTPAELGSQVANPQSTNAFVYYTMRNNEVDRLQQWETSGARSAIPDADVIDLGVP